ncbi:hypothetical protein PHMEG_00037221 [Phytophthora megakarya]|uniref:SET domain-containing protein n=1 Tax=Phytophthora megakarya TaxID=4795 RepID=A0A225UMM8_9STRA|nr:hypothetical protein PHMEG_00037221 [Phytophthora megakarya]
MARCNAVNCLNAREGRFCTTYNCAFRGESGNGLRECPDLVISRNRRTGMQGLVASAAIPAGEVIGQYLGYLQVFGPPCKNGPVNDGYRMHLKPRTNRNKFVGLDAVECGSKMRLLNHSCKA